MGIILNSSPSLLLFQEDKKDVISVLHISDKYPQNQLLFHFQISEILKTLRYCILEA